MNAPPAVWVDPARMSGSPCIGGTRIPVEHVAGMVLTDDVAAAERTWELARAQVLGACWYMALYGPKRFKPWRKWAREFHGDGTVPDPPREQPKTQPTAKRDDERGPHADRCYACLLRRVRHLRSRGLTTSLVAQLIDGLPLNVSEIAVLESATPVQIEQLNRLSGAVSVGDRGQQT